MSDSLSSPTLALETLGCKVNQYESSFFLEALQEAGYRLVSFRESADVYFVHSCAVTSRAGVQTRQLLRRAQRLNPQATIVVAGCYAQLEPDRLALEQLATHVLGNVEKFDLLQWLEVPGNLSRPCSAVGNVRSHHEFTPLHVTRMHSGRARAFLKVQDGCDAFCSYCIVPYTRGKSRSLPLEGISNQMSRFLEHGYREVVLTGIHLGQWGKDLDPQLDLTSLLTSLNEMPLPARVRLSSLEPMEWTEALLGKLASWPWICPHFHVPLQSGDKEILKGMHRPYTPRRYAELVQEFRFRFPRAAIGADVLVGFPGETERRFQNTLQLVSELPLTYLHVFPYSPRPGTLAARWPERTTGPELKHRVQILNKLSSEKRQAFRDSFTGHSLEVLAETQVKPGWWQGTSENYLQVRFPASWDPLQGTLVRVRITGMDEQALLGQPLAILP